MTTPRDFEARRTTSVGESCCTTSTTRSRSSSTSRSSRPSGDPRRSAAGPGELAPGSAGPVDPELLAEDVRDLSQGGHLAQRDLHGHEEVLAAAGGGTDVLQGG